jgi:hypothetical protein
MSRSYRKKYAWETGEYDYSRSPHGWKSIRFAELQAVKDEMGSPEYGDVIFPLNVRTRKVWSHMNDGHSSKQWLRDFIMGDIGNILNNYSSRWYQGTNYREEFLVDFYRIKKGENPLKFKWLNFNEAKRIIRAWKEEPVDVLYYLNRCRVIEKVVWLDYHKTVRK